MNIGLILQSHRCVGEIEYAFLANESSHEENHNIRIGHPQFGSDTPAFIRVAPKSPQIDTVPDHDQIAASRDPKPRRSRSIALALTEEEGRLARREPLQREIRRRANTRFLGAEGKPVEGMGDARAARKLRGEPPDEPRYRGVRVDDGRGPPAQFSREPHKGAPIR